LLKGVWLQVSPGVLKVKNYGEVFNFDETEPFRDEPIAAGSKNCAGENIISI
jgi:hypothetical protein